MTASGICSFRSETFGAYKRQKLRLALGLVRLSFGESVDRLQPSNFLIAIPRVVKLGCFDASMLPSSPRLHDTRPHPRGTKLDDGRPPWWDRRGLVNYFKKLKLNPVHLPDEILALIAQQCVERYSFVSPGLQGRKALSRFCGYNDEDSTPLYVLATVSRLFYHGIKTGLVQHFDGKLVLQNDKFWRSGARFMEDVKWDWFMMKITVLYLQSRPGLAFPDPAMLSTQFPNLRTVVLGRNYVDKRYEYSNEQKAGAIAIETAKSVRQLVDKAETISSGTYESAKYEILFQQSYTWKTSYGMCSLTTEIDIMKDPPVVLKRGRSETYFEGEKLSSVLSRKPSPWDEVSIPQTLGFRGQIQVSCEATRSFFQR